MKAMPTLEGGLRIDAESPNDWTVLRSIVADAGATNGVDLASRLGALISEEAGAEDWEEYIVPDLRESFQDDLAQVGANIESAIFEVDGAAGPVWISRADVFPWYSALNQARLSLEEIFHFGPGEDIDPASYPPAMRAAYIRTRFYGTIQELLLDHVMR
jgi:hypothetical protein